MKSRSLRLLILYKNLLVIDLNRSNRIRHFWFISGCKSVYWDKTTLLESHLAIEEAQTDLFRHKSILKIFYFSFSQNYFWAHYFSESYNIFPISYIRFFSIFDKSFSIFYLILKYIFNRKLWFSVSTLKWDT